MKKLIFALFFLSAECHAEFSIGQYLEMTRSNDPNSNVLLGWYFGSAAEAFGHANALAITKGHPIYCEPKASLTGKEEVRKLLDEFIERYKPQPGDEKKFKEFMSFPVAAIMANSLQRRFPCQ